MSNTSPAWPSTQRDQGPPFLDDRVVALSGPSGSLVAPVSSRRQLSHACDLVQLKPQLQEEHLATRLPHKWGAILQCTCRVSVVSSPFRLTIKKEQFQCKTYAASSGAQWAAATCAVDRCHRSASRWKCRHLNWRMDSCCHMESTASTPDLIFTHFN